MDKIWKIECLVVVLAITAGVEVVRLSYSSVQMGAPRRGAIKHPKRR